MTGGLGWSHPAGSLRIHPHQGPDQGEGRPSTNGNKEGKFQRFQNPSSAFQLWLSSSLGPTRNLEGPAEGASPVPESPQRRMILPRVSSKPFLLQAELSPSCLSSGHPCPAQRGHQDRRHLAALPLPSSPRPVYFVTRLSHCGVRSRSWCLNPGVCLCRSPLHIPGQEFLGVGASPQRLPAAGCLISAKVPCQTLFQALYID